MIHKIKDIIYILKNSNLIVRATFIALVILVLGYIKATCFAYTIEEVETYTRQALSNTSGASKNMILGVMNSNAWLEYKNEIPTDQYESVIVRSFRDSSVNWYVDIIPFSNNLVFSLNTQGNLTWSGTFTTDRWRFNGKNQNNVAYTTYNGKTENITWSSNGAFCASNNANSDYIFYLIFTHNQINNANNVTIYGLNYTANIWIPYKTTYIENNKQHRLGERNNRSVLL